MAIFCELNEKQGIISGPFSTGLFVFDPELAKLILTNFSDKACAYEHFKVLFGDGLVNW